MIPSTRHTSGFSLVEMALVLVLIALLLGGLMAPLTETMDRMRRADAQRQLDLITEALLGFAASWDRLPCPASPASKGAESPAGVGACSQQHGFVPAATLGISGAVNNDNLLTDPWGNPYRYSISNPGSWEFTKTNGLTLATTGDLVICTRSSTLPGACSPDTGPNPSLTVGIHVPAIVLSMGADWAQVPSADEAENAGEGMLGGYPVGANRVFVSHPVNHLPGNEYDDMTAWISTHVLFSKMLTANRLP